MKQFFYNKTLGIQFEIDLTSDAINKIKFPFRCFSYSVSSIHSKKLAITNVTVK